MFFWEYLEKYSMSSSDIFASLYKSCKDFFWEKLDFFLGKYQIYAIFRCRLNFYVNFLWKNRSMKNVADPCWKLQICVPFFTLSCHGGKNLQICAERMTFYKSVFSDVEIFKKCPILTDICFTIFLCSTSIFESFKFIEVYKLRK